MEGRTTGRSSRRREYSSEMEAAMPDPGGVCASSPVMETGSGLQRQESQKGSFVDRSVGAFAVDMNHVLENKCADFLRGDNPEGIEARNEFSSQLFSDLLDSLIMDVASESHRIARLGLDRNLEVEDEELMLSAQARVKVADPSYNGEATGKYVVDIFGQTHPTIANEVFDCMNCGRSIAAGRFAPHLEKCMGKGRKAARLKVTRSSTSAQNQYSRGSPVSASSAYSNSMATNRLSNGSYGVAGNEYHNTTNEDS